MVNWLKALASGDGKISSDYQAFVLGGMRRKVTGRLAVLAVFIAVVKNVPTSLPNRNGEDSAESLLLVILFSDHIWAGGFLDFYVLIVGQLRKGNFKNPVKVSRALQQPEPHDYRAFESFSLYLFHHMRFASCAI